MSCGIQILLSRLHVVIIIAKFTKIIYVFRPCTKSLTEAEINFISPMREHIDFFVYNAISFLIYFRQNPSSL